MKEISLRAILAIQRMTSGSFGKGKVFVSSYISEKLLYDKLWFNKMAYEEYLFGSYTWLSMNIPTHLKYGEARKFWDIKGAGTCCLIFEGWQETGTIKIGVLILMINDPSAPSGIQSQHSLHLQLSHLSLTTRGQLSKIKKRIMLRGDEIRILV